MSKTLKLGSQYNTQWLKMFEMVNTECLSRLNKSRKCYWPKSKPFPWQPDLILYDLSVDSRVSDSCQTCSGNKENSLQIIAGVLLWFTLHETSINKLEKYKIIFLNLYSFAIWWNYIIKSFSFLLVYNKRANLHEKVLWVK